MNCLTRWSSIKNYIFHHLSKLNFGGFMTSKTVITFFKNWRICSYIIIPNFFVIYPAVHKSSSMYARLSCTPENTLEVEHLLLIKEPGSTEDLKIIHLLIQTDEGCKQSPSLLAERNGITLMWVPCHWRLKDIEEAEILANDEANTLSVVWQLSVNSQKTIWEGNSSDGNSISQKVPGTTYPDKYKEKVR